MDRVSYPPQVGMSVNASGTLETSTVASPSQVIPRTSQDINISQNIAFTTAPNLTQIVLHDNARHDGMPMKYLTNPVQQQPLIIGNVNAASLLTAALTNRGDNSVVIPAGMMGLSASVNSNSLLGIVPVFIQGTGGGWLQPSSRPCDEKNNPARTSQQMGECISTAAHNINYTFSHSQIPQTCVKTASTSDQQPVMSSSDTLILHRLSSQDTVKLPSQQVPKSSDLNVYPLQTLPSLNSTFSLLPNIPDRTVSLTSIPTVTLFSPEQADIKNSTSQVPVTSEGKEAIAPKDFSSSNNSSEMSQNESPSVCHEDQAQTKSVQEKRKNKERLSESEPCQLRIDESVDTDISDTDIEDSQPNVIKESNLTRADTMILNDKSSKAKENNSEMSCMSDHVPDIVYFEKSNTNLSQGVNTESMNVEQPSGNGVEIYGNISSSDSSNLSATPQHQQTINEKLNSFQSVPNLVLTDSIVNGTYNPNILCSLLSQNSNIQKPSLITSITLDPVDSETLTELTPVQHQSNTNSDMPHIQMSLPNTSHKDGASFSDVYDSNSSSAKGTQTDWIFGKASIYFKPVKMSEIENSIAGENNQVESSTEHDSNTPSAVVVVENAEDVINSPLILDEQAVPASVLNLIPPHVNLFNSTAETNQTVVTPATGVGEAAGSSRPVFPCSSCDQSFLTKRTLDRHMKIHRKVLKCDLCTSTFTRMGNYVRHRKIHNLQPESQNVFTCEHCNREFLQKCDLRRHLLIHTKQEPYRCEICGKGYIRRSDLVVHVRFHNKEKAFKCGICDKGFFQSGDLGRHIRRTHNPNSELTCGHCHRKYACETTLIRHMKVMHKDIILKTVNKRLQEKKDDQSNINNQDLLFAMNEGNDGREQEASSS